jgi:sulfur carrier protein
VNIFLNGERHTVAEGSTVASLLDQLGLHRPGVAVAVNFEIAPRAGWSTREVNDGDRLEVLSPAPGG